MLGYLAPYANAVYAMLKIPEPTETRTTCITIYGSRSRNC